MISRDMTNTKTLKQLMIASLFFVAWGCGSSLTNRQSQENTGVLTEDSFPEVAESSDSTNVESEVTQADEFEVEFDSGSDVAFEDEGSGASGDDFSEDELFEDNISAEDAAIEDSTITEDTFSEFDSMADSSSATTDQGTAIENSFEDTLDSSFSDVSQDPVQDNLISLQPSNSMGGNQITGLEYDSRLRGGSVVIRGANNLEFNTRFDSSKSQYIIDIQNTTIPDIYKRPLFMKDFGQNFGAVSSYENSDGSARIIIQVKNNMEPNVSVEGQSIVVSPGNEMTSGLALTPNNNQYPNSNSGSYVDASSNENLAGGQSASLEDYLLENGTFSGETISLQVNDEDVKTVINFIADQSGANLVIGPGVDGKITLKLRDIPWDQALMTIMKTQGLGYIRSGNVLRIGKLEDLQKESDAALKIRESQTKLEPIIMKVIPLKYASPEEIQKKLEVLITKERGSILSDLRTSSVIVNDTISVINKMSTLIKELDTPPPQVLIEAKIVEATKTFVRQIGLRWGIMGQPTNLDIDGGSGQQVSIHPSLRLNDIFTNQGQVTGGTDPLSAGLRIGSFDFLGNINAVLNLSEQDDEVKIISSPRVVTLNNQQASIVQATELIRVRTLVAEGQTSQEPITVPVELNLQVTPQITSDASIMLDVDVKREFPGLQDPLTGQSPKNTRQAKTKILVDNNKTAVIGGIYQNDSQRGVLGVPLLKDIPIFGWLFKTTRKEKTDTELMIFITPRILDKNYQTSNLVAQ